MKIFKKQIIFSFVILLFLHSISYNAEILNELEKKHYQNQQEINKLIKLILENTAILKQIDNEILKLKNNKDWVNDIKLNLLLKRSFAINLEIEKFTKQKELIEFVQQDLEKKIINEIEKKILSLINKKNINLSELYGFYNKRLYYVSGSIKARGLDFEEEKNKYLTDKSLVFEEQNIIVRLGLLHDLITQVKLELEKLNQQINILNKEIDLSNKLIYHFNNNEIVENITEKKDKMNELKRQYSLKHNYFIKEYAELIENHNKLYDIVYVMQKNWQNAEK